MGWCQDGGELKNRSLPLAWIEANHSAKLTCGDGDGRDLCAKRIDCTDFPLQGIRFYYANWVIHLPSEY